ncbi:MAG: hypothetical protein L0220_17395, partial [Acidobacteria bacterium]|nr:hypothetical protein [Acidobacteriota bacterium]
MTEQTEITEQTEKGPNFSFCSVISVCSVILLTLVLSPIPIAAQNDSTKSWVITLEEPTGIYRRDNEVVTVRLNFKEGEARNHQLQVIAPDGHEIVSQVEIKEKHNDGSIKSADLLFQATIVPGERPEYRLLTRDASQGRAPTKTDLVARRLGVGRFEMANDRFGVIVNLGFENTEPALVAAFNKTAGEHRMLNLVDTSPDVNESLAYGKKSAGFGTFLTAKSQLQRTGAFDQIEIIE